MPAETKTLPCLRTGSVLARSPGEHSLNLQLNGILPGRAVLRLEHTEGEV